MCHQSQLCDNLSSCVTRVSCVITSHHVTASIAIGVLAESVPQLTWGCHFQVEWSVPPGQWKCELDQRQRGATYISRWRHFKGEAAIIAQPSAALIVGHRKAEDIFTASRRTLTTKYSDNYCVIPWLASSC